MSEPVTRYSITVPQPLMEAFDRRIQGRQKTNRSEAIRDLIRDSLVEERWSRDDEVVMGTLTVVYDHHQRELAQRLTAVQHDAHDLVVCTTHVHLDHCHCMEVIVMRGEAVKVQRVSDAIIGTRGVIHGKLVCTAVEDPGEHHH